MSDFVSEHNLLFETREWWFDNNKTEFCVGTCEGLYYCDKKNYIILAIRNNSPGNGHFNDVIQWFENSCKRDKRNLVFECIINDRFKKYLLKNGFKVCNKYDNALIKKI